jgi:hypothetical protein
MFLLVFCTSLDVRMQALNSYLIQFYSIPTGSMYSVSAIVDGVIPISVRFYILLSVVGGIMS